MIHLKKAVPNIILWSWMRNVLKLSGNSLLVFSCIFSQTPDPTHGSCIPMQDFEYWLGLTRQAISRIIKSLCEKNYVCKDCKVNKQNPMIKYNMYFINFNYVRELCQKSCVADYQNFIESYDHALKCFDESGNIDVLTMAQAQNIENVSDIPDVHDALKALNTKEHSESTYIFKDKKSTTSDQKTLISAPKRKSKASKRNEWDVEKRTMSQDFVCMNAQGNEELLELLNNFLDTDNGRSYTPQQWQAQLDNLQIHGRTVQRMIDGVRTSYMNNYRQLYIRDKSEVEIDEKMSLIDEYVASSCNNNEEIKELLISYVMDVPRAKASTARQFKMNLATLSSICTTEESKLNSIRNSYANSYASLAYSNSGTTVSSTVDIDEKIDAVHTFISKGYYHLVKGLQDSLITYVKDTDKGRSVTLSKFNIMLDSLRLYCLDDDDKVSKVKLAIQNNSDKFATEDFSETAKIRAKMETRESLASDYDRSRYQKVVQYKMRHKNDPLVQDVEIPEALRR